MRLVLRARCTLRSPHPAYWAIGHAPSANGLTLSRASATMKRAFRSACVGVEPWFERGNCAQRHDRSHCQIVLLGRARINADGGPGDVALRREYALSGADRAGRDAIHTGLRHGAAYAGKPLDRAERRTNSGNAHFCDALSLGSYPGDTVFLSVVRRKQRISFLQLPLKISGTRQPEAGL